MTFPVSMPQVALACTPLSPFGLLMEAEEEPDLADLPPEVLAQWACESRVLVLRGFPLLAKDAFADYCRRWGELLTWDFGEVLELKVHEDPKNYLFSRGEAPFHWDGVFASAAPRFFMFQCVDATPGAGGETVFCDTTRVYRDADPQVRARWARVTVTYTTDKLAHYGGRATEKLVSRHPYSWLPTVRFAEPLHPDHFLNPLFVEVDGVDPAEVPDILADLAERLHRPEYCYAHDWRPGDIVIADNHALLHGRNAFTGPATRHLQRVQVI